MRSTRKTFHLPEYATLEPRRYLRTSGAMNGMVPAAFSVRGRDGSRRVDTPRSATLTAPVLVRRTLAGLRSR